MVTVCVIRLTLTADVKDFSWDFKEADHKQEESPLDVVSHAETIVVPWASQDEDTGSRSLQVPEQSERRRRWRRCRRFRFVFARKFFLSMFTVAHRLASVVLCECFDACYYRAVEMTAKK